LRTSEILVLEKATSAMVYRRRSILGLLTRFIPHRFPRVNTYFEPRIALRNSAVNNGGVHTRNAWKKLQKMPPPVVVDSKHKTRNQKTRAWRAGRGFSDCATNKKINFLSVTTRYQALNRAAFAPRIRPETINSARTDPLRHAYSNLRITPADSDFKEPRRSGTQHSHFGWGLPPYHATIGATARTIAHRVFDCNCFLCPPIKNRKPKIKILKSS
jgi:hypothetical protein